MSPSRWVGTLYFAEGLPATVVATIAGILLKKLGVANQSIALYASLLIVPWTLKPLWSPLLEHFQSKRFFIVATELAIGLGLAGVALVLPFGASAPLCMTLLAFVALSAATHDIAADGLYICALSQQEQARYIGWLSTAFVAAKFTVQGLLVVLAGTLEASVGVVKAWQAVFFVLGALMVLVATYHARVLPRIEGDRGVGSVAQMARTSRDVVTTFLTMEQVHLLAAFALFYRVTEGQLARIVPLFILDPQERGGLGLSTIQVGAFYGGLGAGVFVLGALVGARAAARWGLGRVLFPLCVAVNIPAVLYFWLAWRRPSSVGAMGAVILIEQLCYGMGAIGLKLLTMRAFSGGRFAAAHFSFASALTSIGAMAAGTISGLIQGRFGYVSFFQWSIVASAPGLFAGYVSARQLRESQRSGTGP